MTHWITPGNQSSVSRPPMIAIAKGTVIKATVTAFSPKIYIPKGRATR